ncbi:phosphatidylinositol-glycan biosynthesis class X protein isoform X3 [Hypomesus transpacificus]|uniref:phosphatidylinositol-glycan biosynthesis class X protein isoform X3 n=1 Tax=Hypomesus transpacificus TaxID=137520 RepID=UPI001F080620|nr:phosphatidylinositol-glycan biosynthesis class X protein isoform X3 [Hypomesus transpacificus]
MYPVLLFCVYLLFFYGSTKSDENNCGLSSQVLKHAFVSMNIKKSGFHRELVTTVEFSPEAPNRLRILLSYRFPSGLYIDPYQLAPPKEDLDLQVLLNSAIDVETPAHMSAGFTALVYTSPFSSTSQHCGCTMHICQYKHVPVDQHSEFAGAQTCNSGDATWG